MNNKEQKLAAFERILKIMDELREQCPWDKKQTFETLRLLTIEETYELGDAILQGDMKGIKEEIGDLLLHIVFYARIGEEKNAFDISTVINDLCEKLIYRHPHIYGDPANAGQVVKVNNEDDVKKNWEQLKMREGKKSVLGGVPASLPALIKAYRMQEKAAQVKFEWENIEDVWKKVEEELDELKTEINKQESNNSKVEEEFGDLLFALVNYSRFLKIDPESALERTNIKFMRRFKFIEERAEKLSKPLKDMTLEEMDGIWNEAKAAGL